MKKILSAWIEQYLQFDSKLEYLVYISHLEQKKQKFQEMEYSQDASGKVTLRIRKQYTKNTFQKFQ